MKSNLRPNHRPPDHTTAMVAPDVGQRIERGPQTVAELAYHRYISQGSQPGNDVCDWLHAEAQLKAQCCTTLTTGVHHAP